VARPGGDEFAIILSDVAQIQDVARISQKIINLFTKPFKVENQEIFATVSMGISICPSDGKDVETLLRKTDIAMYQSKEKGRNNYRFYLSEMNTKISEWLSLETALHYAIDRGELFLYYQPKVNLNSRQVIGTEALIRWIHPNLGFVPPVQFIPIAEETGLIESIGKWVLFEACTTGKAWQDAGYKDIQVSVNLSARQFHQKDLVETVENVLKKTSFDPHSLELELTESMLQNMDLVLSPLQKLFDMGIQISIDDFGTGFSSLSYLKKLPINKVKIDQSFIRDIATDQSDAAIVRAIVTMAHHLNLKVTAEGVETGEQLEFLHALNCDEIQGYVFSPPLPLEEATKILAQKKSL
jgi:EAL domain-containing protein (putative c-di-GMP-specific phosphodiesterase class I)